MTQQLLQLPPEQLEEALGKALLYCRRPESRKGASWESLAKSHPSLERSPEELRFLMRWISDLRLVDGYTETEEGFSVSRITEIGTWRLKKKFVSSMPKLMLAHALIATVLTALFLVFLKMF